MVANMTMTNMKLLNYVNIHEYAWHDLANLCENENRGKIAFKNNHIKLALRDVKFES